MTLYPINKHLTDYPFISTEFPFHVSINEIQRHFQAHRHDFLEFSLVIEGEGYETINGEKHPMHRGMCTFLLPYQVHELYTESQQPLLLYNCMFDLDLLFQPSNQAVGLSDLLFAEDLLPAFIALNSNQYQLMAAILEDLLLEYNGVEVWRTVMLQQKLTEALVRFDRMRRQGHTLPVSTAALYTKPIWPIIHYIHSHYREPISLSSLAEQFGMSSSYLSEEIKRHVGLNFVHFLHEIRIRHACGLLNSTEMGGVDIAVEVGFGSFKTFSRIFRQLKGITPGEYRKRHLMRREHQSV